MIGRMRNKQKCGHARVDPGGACGACGGRALEDRVDIADGPTVTGPTYR